MRSEHIQTQLQGASSSRLANWHGREAGVTVHRGVEHNVLSGGGNFKATRIKLNPLNNSTPRNTFNLIYPIL